MAQSPIIKDSTGQAILQAIQALSAPSATNVAVDPTGMDIITAENAQGALKQLDTAVDSVNASLTQLLLGKIGNNIEILTFNNAVSYTIDLGYTPSNNKYGSIFILNANQNQMFAVKIDNSITPNTWIGSRTLTASISGQTLTLTPSTTMWGSSLVIHTHN